MKNDIVVTIKQLARHKGAVSLLASVLIGLVLARFMMISTTAAVLALSSGIVLALSILLRKTDYLIFCWFVLTSVMHFLLINIFPIGYYPIIGRGIFWGILFCIIVAWGIDHILRNRQFTPFDNVPLKTIIVIFLLWCVMTLTTSIDVLNSVKKLAHIAIAFIASYMFYDLFCQDENNVKKMLNIVSLVVVFVSFGVIAVAIRSLATGIPIYKDIQLWFVNPNVLGAFLFVCSPILITSGFDFRPIKRFKFFAISVMLCALFISFSRSAWLALLVSISYLLWKGRTRLSMVAATILVLFVAGLTLPLWGGNFYDYVTGERYTGRKIIWQGAWDTACDYPVLGTGLGNSKQIIGKYIDDPYLAVGFVDAHSAYLQNVVDMGFASAFILIAFYVVFLYSSERIERNLKSHHLRLVVRGTTATFLGLLFHGIFETGTLFSSFDGSEFHVLFPYVLMGLPFAAKKLEEKAEGG